MVFKEQEIEIAMAEKERSEAEIAPEIFRSLADSIEIRNLAKDGFTEISVELQDDPEATKELLLLLDKLIESGQMAELLTNFDTIYFENFHAGNINKTAFPQLFARQIITEEDEDFFHKEKIQKSAKSIFGFFTESETATRSRHNPTAYIKEQVVQDLVQELSRNAMSSSGELNLPDWMSHKTRDFITSQLSVRLDREPDDIQKKKLVDSYIHEALFGLHSQYSGEPGDEDLFSGEQKQLHLLLAGAIYYDFYKPSTLRLVNNDRVRHKFIKDPESVVSVDSMPLAQSSEFPELKIYAVSGDELTRIQVE